MIYLLAGVIALLIFLLFVLFDVREIVQRLEAAKQTATQPGIPGVQTRGGFKVGPTRIEITDQQEEQFARIKSKKKNP